MTLPPRSRDVVVRQSVSQTHANKMECVSLTGQTTHVSAQVIMQDKTARQVSIMFNAGVLYCRKVLSLGFWIFSSAFRLDSSYGARISSKQAFLTVHVPYDSD